MEQEHEDLAIQQQYAKILKIVTNLGLGCLLLTFALYVFGILEPLVPLEELPHYWNLPLQEFIAKTNAPTGWHWLAFLNKGDYLNFASLALFAGVTGLCYLVLLVNFVKTQKLLYASLAALELLLILFAASNLVSLNH